MSPFTLIWAYYSRSTYTKIGTIQRRLAWPLRKDDTQIREAFHIFLFFWRIQLANTNCPLPHPPKYYPILFRGPWLTVIVGTVLIVCVMIVINVSLEWTRGINVSSWLPRSHSHSCMSISRVCENSCCSIISPFVISFRENSHNVLQA